MTGTEQVPGRADRAVSLTILVVANDPKLLKLLDMALPLAFGCQVLTVS